MFKKTKKVQENKVAPLALIEMLDQRLARQEMDVDNGELEVFLSLIHIFKEHQKQNPCMRF